MPSKEHQKPHIFFLILLALSAASCGQAISREENLSSSALILTQTTLTPFLPALTQTAPFPTQTAQVVTPSGSCKKIVFVMSNAQSGVRPDIYAVFSDGSSLTRLTDDPAADVAPAWSRDGTRLAFASGRAGGSQVFVVDANGNNPDQLTFDEQNDLPVWLPDGEYIAFRTTDGSGLWWWRIINLQNKEITQFSEPSYDFFFQTPAWSPDGQSIAYMSLPEQQFRNDGASQIHVKNVDGLNNMALTHDTWANIRPAWSSDGAKIAFLSEQDGA